MSSPEQSRSSSSDRGRGSPGSPGRRRSPQPRKGRHGSPGPSRWHGKRSRSRSRSPARVVRNRRSRSSSRDRYDRYRSRPSSRDRGRQYRSRSPAPRRSERRSSRERDRGDDRERYRDRYHDGHRRDWDRDRGRDWGGRDDRGRHLSPGRRGHSWGKRSDLGDAPDRDAGRPRGPPLKSEPPAVGQVLQGVVMTVKPFGVFVQLEGYRAQGLVHSSQISEEVELTRNDADDLKIKALEHYAPPGSKVWVKVTTVQHDSAQRLRVACSMKLVDQDSGKDLDPDGKLQAASGGMRQRGNISDDPPELHSIHEAAVQKVAPYGLFVELQGYRRYGLVPSHQVSEHLHLNRDDSDAEKVAALQSVAEKGDRVWVKVVEVERAEDGRNHKIGCSIKVVSQRDGKDLDPNNLQYRPRGEGGGGGGRGKARIGADAGEVQQDGQVKWGHLAADVKRYAGQGADKYELISDLGDGAPPHSGPGSGAGGGAAPPGPGIGRGRGAVTPAWMSEGATGATAVSAPGGSGSGGINSVEDALAIVMASLGQKDGKHKKRKSEKHKSEKKKKKSRKEGKEKEKRGKSKSKQGKRQNHEPDDRSGSSSESDG